jgi:hypothetical protein
MMVDCKLYDKCKAVAYVDYRTKKQIDIDSEIPYISKEHRIILFNLIRLWQKDVTQSLTLGDILKAIQEGEEDTNY